MILLHTPIVLDVTLGFVGTCIFGEVHSNCNPEYYSGDYVVLHYYLTVFSLCDRNSMYLAISDIEF